MNVRAFVMRWLRSESTDVPVYLHASAPTVRPDETAKLAARPVRYPSNEPAFSFGRAPARRLIEDQPDYRERQPIDFERLPAA